MTMIAVAGGGTSACICWCSTSSTAGLPFLVGAGSGMMPLLVKRLRRLGRVLRLILPSHCRFVVVQVGLLM